MMETTTPATVDVLKLLMPQGASAIWQAYDLARPLDGVPGTRGLHTSEDALEYPWLEGLYRFTFADVLTRTLGRPVLAQDLDANGLLVLYRGVSDQGYGIAAGRGVVAVLLLDDRFRGGAVTVDAQPVRLLDRELLLLQPGQTATFAPVTVGTQMLAVMTYGV